MDSFRSARLVYRAVEDNPTDEAFLHALFGDPQIKYMASPTLVRPFSTTETKTITREIHRGNFLTVLICKMPEPGDSELEPVPQPIGSMALRPEKPGCLQNRSYECWIVLGREHQGKGYGGEALSWLLEWSFMGAGAHRVELTVYEWNERARKVYEKVGFVHEGRRRKALWRDGRWWDEIRMGMLEDEWKRRV